MTTSLDIVWLCALSFVAGFVDSIAGGGGLIQTPALFIFLPDVPVATIFGTNKLSSIAGTAVAAVQYPRHVDVQWRVTIPATLVAFVCSYLGAMLVSLINAGVLKPVVFVLLVAVAVWTFFAKDFGLRHKPRFGGHRQLLFGAVAGGAIGMYDGFFGPGTGTFLMFVFVGVFGFNFLSATASSKIVNFSTNLAALICFGLTGNINFRVGLPMAACNILGSIAGTRLAVLKGSRFVRVVFLLVSCGMILRFGWQLLHRT